jgi:hypothetical protein
MYKNPEESCIKTDTVPYPKNHYLQVETIFTRASQA